MRQVTEDKVAQLDIKFIENSTFDRFIFIKDSDGTYMDPTGLDVAAPTRATLNGPEAADLFVGITDKPDPNGVIRPSIHISITQEQSLVFDRHFWQLNIDGRPRVVGQLFAKQAQQ